jgi:GTP-binding protein
MFIDTAKVLVQAGKGGDGAVSFRHEIYVDKGGPDGGDGGKGGNVVFMATEDVNTLADFRFKPELKGEPGQNGSKRNKHGKSGHDLQVKVPVGTIVRRGGEVVADLTESGQQVIVARGGDGGFGNAHFKSSTRQAPRVAEKGEPGDTFEAELELKLLADVGLVGFPNAGKSTFLSVVSNARPEIADYAFTTLTPNLGVADIDGDSLLIADIPGLIEGASEGRGLGHAFLRHVERTAVLLHLIDIYSSDPAESYKTIREELKNHSPELVERPEVIALTKAEGLDKELIGMQIDAVRSVAGENAPIFAISAAAHQGLKEVLRTLKSCVEQARKAEAEAALFEEEIGDGIPVISLSDKQLSESWTVVHDEESGMFIVTGDKIEKFARRTDFNNFEGVNRLRDIMNKMGITHELTRRGAEGQSTVSIGGHEFTLTEQ